ncbi:MAG: SurA N-terminal domain-containing protein, partial [Candidatus Omnitrophica bacterium]|nr:SurA N-terminal domain-containing protein [Candidatus Omnitrophota bacterium]
MCNFKSQSLSLAIVLMTSYISFLFSFIPTCFAQNKIVAIVNNDVITQKDLEGFINFARIQLAAEYQGEELENKVQSLRPDLLDRLIDDRLLLQEAKNNNIKIDETRIKAKIEQIKRRYASD